ncbi:MAG: putative baseplate assembly protein [Candidatus Competibacteraceae bacterium]
MSTDAPKIDPRTASDVVKRLVVLLEQYTSDPNYSFAAWKEDDPVTGEPRGRSAALIRIFARFCEIVIEHLNKAPEKNFLAFLDLLGAALQPPQPARVPLSFSLAAGSAVDALVPEGTQVAAPPAPGEKDPVVFETERPLVVTAARLGSLLTLDPEQDSYGDWSERLAAPSAFTVFQGDRAFEHVLYLGDSRLLGYAQIRNLQIYITLASKLPAELDIDVVWEFWDGARWSLLSPRKVKILGHGLRPTILFGRINPLPERAVNQRRSRWLRCRLLTPITRSPTAVAGMVRESDLPEISHIDFKVRIKRTLTEGIAPDLGFTNGVPLDLSKEFFPFGEKPKRYDTLFLASAEAFSKVHANYESDNSAHVEIEVQLANPLASDPGSVGPSADLELTWECGIGGAWQKIGVSTASGSAKQPPTDANGFSDGTSGLCQSGIVQFRLPAAVAKTVVNGQENFWLRVRITKGDYGKEASYVLKDPVKPEDGFTLVPASFRPPIVSKVKLGYELTPKQPPEVCFTYNRLAFQDCTTAAADNKTAFAPFTADYEAQRPALYLGFSPPKGQAAFPNTSISLYHRIAETRYGERTVPLSSEAGTDPAGVVWRYWDGIRWSKLTVQDGSENFTRSGLLEFLAPVDFTSRELFGRSHYWLRAEWDKGEYLVPPRLSQLLLNTTLATQTITLVNEILGSSNGMESQQFLSTRAPILAGQRLEVREPEMPSVKDQNILKKEEGDKPINVVVDAAGQPREIWVRWHEAPDFYGSGPSDRHYVINHLTGEIRFGDGKNGRIPPRGTGNLRLARYQTGGGPRGNRAAGTIAQLKTTVPYIEKAINPAAATGGAEAETAAALVERMPPTLRHRDRAVTLEDYEDLALLASPEVARARCVPLRDLKANPLGLSSQPGTVSLIVVPHADDVKPLPTLELLARVQDYVGARADATVKLAVVGPLYIRVDVRAEVAVTNPEGASAVERAVHERLATFLHPLTGGLNGGGWDFGRAPHKSDFYALIEAVSGVDHIRYLQITEVESQTGVRRTGRFLVFSGEHQIDLAFAET